MRVAGMYVSYARASGANRYVFRWSKSICSPLSSPLYRCGPFPWEGMGGREGCSVFKY